MNEKGWNPTKMAAIYDMATSVTTPILIILAIVVVYILWKVLKD